MWYGVWLGVYRAAESEVQMLCNIGTHELGYTLNQRKHKKCIVAEMVSLPTRHVMVNMGRFGAIVLYEQFRQINNLHSTFRSTLCH